MNESPHQHGQSMIQVLIGLGVMSVVMLSMASMFLVAYRESRASAEKIATLDLKNLLNAALADGSVCKYVLNNPAPLTFDSQALPQTITLPAPAPGVQPALYASIIGGVPGPVVAQVDSMVGASSAKIGSIQLQISQGSAGIYRGDWLVNFDGASTIRALRPVSVSTVLTADDLTDPNRATITSCSVNSGTGPTRMPYYKMYWDLGNICQSGSAGFPRAIAGAWATGGEINLSYWGRPYASVLFEMTIRAPAPTAVTQYLGYVDDQIYFWLNGNLVGAVGAAGYYNSPFTWNLVRGNNLIQIVINDCFWAVGHEGVALIGDFFSAHPELEFVP